MKIDGLEEALQHNREEVIHEIHETVDGAHEAITKQLDYVLEQSTDHKQEVESGLRKARNQTDQLQSVLRDEFKTIANAFHDIHETTRRQVSKMAAMIWALVVINITMAITLLAHSL